ncbi:MAG TPA: hypothetical protein VFQ53_02495 [Kofleriaceae bacterium]|nr:hypothetical protein [Kofleriaceae bacterium]
MRRLEVGRPAGEWTWRARRPDLVLEVCLDQIELRLDAPNDPRSDGRRVPARHLQLGHEIRVLRLLADDLDAAAHEHSAMAIDPLRLRTRITNTVGLALRTAPLPAALLPEIERDRRDQYRIDRRDLRAATETTSRQRPRDRDHARTPPPHAPRRYEPAAGESTRRDAAECGTARRGHLARTRATDLALMLSGADLSRATVSDGAIVAPVPAVVLERFAGRIDQPLPLGTEAAIECALVTIILMDPRDRVSRTRCVAAPAACDTCVVTFDRASVSACSTLAAGVSRCSPRVACH